HVPGRKAYERVEYPLAIRLDLVVHPLVAMRVRIMVRVVLSMLGHHPLLPALPCFIAPRRTHATARTGRLAASSPARAPSRPRRRLRPVERRQRRAHDATGVEACRLVHLRGRILV